MFWFGILIGIWIGILFGFFLALFLGGLPSNDDTL